MSGSVAGSTVGGRTSRASPRLAGGGGITAITAPLTPKQLLKRVPLPTAAHLRAPTHPPGLDLSKPLLLYSHYTSTKVRGVSLRPSVDGKMSPVGPPIVIPDSYTGWFALITSDGHTAPFYSNIQQVAESQATLFLTRYDVPAFYRHEEGYGGANYQPAVIQSGHILKLMGVFEDLSTRRISSRSPQMTQSTCHKYAQCLNYKNEVVYLPFNASGRFYSAASKTSRSPNHVYLMSHIIKNHKLPVTVRLVCGYMPRVPCSFTGVLRLERMQKESIILACTMSYEADATLFEIEVNSNFLLTPVNDPLLSRTPIFLKSISYCEDEADGWRRQIKVTHHVTEANKRSKSLTRSLSDKFVEPLSYRPLSLNIITDSKIYSRERSQERNSRDKIKKDSQERKYSSRDRGGEKSRDRSSDTKGTERNTLKVLEKGLSYRNYITRVGSVEKIFSSDNWRLAKQNPYVLQDESSMKNININKSTESLNNKSRSSESLNYTRARDDISPIQESEEGDSHYTEIGEALHKNNQTNDVIKSGLLNSIINFNNANNDKENDRVSIENSKNNMETSNVNSTDTSIINSMNINLFNANTDLDNDDLYADISNINDIHESKFLEHTEEKVVINTAKLNEIEDERIYDLPQSEKDDVKILSDIGKENDITNEENNNNKENESKEEHADINRNQDNKDHVNEENSLEKENEVLKKNAHKEANVNEDNSLEKENDVQKINVHKEANVNEENILEKENEIIKKNSYNETEKIKIETFNDEVIRIEILDSDDEKKGTEKYENEKMEKKISKVNNSDEIKKEINEKKTIGDKEKDNIEIMNINNIKCNIKEEKDKENKENESIKTNRELYVVRISIGSSENSDDNEVNISQRDSGGYFVNVKGFEVPDSELSGSVSGDEINGYGSLC